MAAGLPKRRHGSSRGLPVYICEYHDEALRCLHHAIRRRRVPFGGLTMVHLDAHPDLSASTTLPAETVFESPHVMYHALRTDPSGIAQWILPAVYGGHFRCVWWVRPEWAEQIADGDYPVAVGRAARAIVTSSTASKHGLDAPADGPTDVLAAPEDKSQHLPTIPPETIRISCAEPYFVEDGTYCPDSELLGSKPLRLVVSQLPSNEAMPFCVLGDDPNAEGGQGMARDTSSDGKALSPGCWTLDVCLDFFACGNPFLKRVRPCVAEPLAAVQNCAAFRQQSVADVPAFLAARDAFDVAYAAVLQDGLAQEGRVGAQALEALGSFLPAEDRADLLEALGGALEEARPGELQEVLEAADMVTLPAHPGQEAEVLERLASFEAFLGRLSASGGGAPAVVTVARSVVDGFCPMRWHCLLERHVLEAVERRFGALEVVYADELDFLENP